MDVSIVKEIISQRNLEERQDISSYLRQNEASKDEIC